jgi:hypothetical protein
MGSFPNPIAASQEIDTYTELREQIYRNPSLWSTYAELQQRIYRHPRLWKREVISQRPRFSSLTHVKKLAAIIAVLGFVFWLWFGVSTYHAPRASYPYYDTQKPVPPWSEPMPLIGNHDRGEKHK